MLDWRGAATGGCVGAAGYQLDVREGRNQNLSGHQGLSMGKKCFLGNLVSEGRKPNNEEPSSLRLRCGIPQFGFGTSAESIIRGEQRDALHP
jgi:hypothetical protein